MVKKTSSKPSIRTSFIRQIVIFSIFIMALLFGLRYFMRSYTNHGQQIEVNDYRKMSLDEARKAIRKDHLRLSIQDSTYNAELPPGTIIDQNPRPSSKVKRKRTVYLVINTSTAPPVKMPNLIDNTKRQAELRLKNLGLNVGKISYEPDLARDVVLKQLYNGEPIKQGDKILKGETVDLVLGDGFGNTTMSIPNLVGLTYAEAQITLGDFGLRVGKVTKEGTIEDESTALVYEQSPASIPGNTLEQGATIDIYLTAIPN